MNRSNCKRYLMILPAAFGGALALDLFFLPFKIVTGGVVGISTIFHSAFGFNMSIMILAINIPILLMALKYEGSRFILDCLLTSVAISFFIEIFSQMQPITTQPLTAAICGGLVQGISLGICYRYRVSSGGTEVLARVFKRRFPKLTVGTIIIILDGSIILIGSIVLRKPDTILLAFISIFLIGKVSDLVINGFDRTKLGFIHRKKAGSEPGHQGS